MKKKFSIKIMEKKDLNNFFNFIENHWKKNYIFVRDKNFFHWQFYNNKNKKYNFVIAKINNKIIGCLGYIPNSIYSSNFIKNDFLWLVNWITNKKYSFVSLRLINYLLNKIKYSFIGTIGCTKNTFKILKTLGFKNGQLIHLASKNSSLKFFKISNFTKNKSVNIKKKIDYKTCKINLKELSIFFKSIEPINYKDEEYFLKRYLNHPNYKYNFYGIYYSGNPLGFFVTRVCKFNDCSSLKIVDYHGKKINITESFKALHKTVKKSSHEFLDFYMNSNSNFFEKYSNFKVNKKIIAPNFFDPFLKKNVKIRYAYHSKKISIKPFLVRGDCDQDRPS
jgi:hypothetical protein